MKEEYFVVMWQHKGTTKPVRIFADLQEAVSFTEKSAFSYGLYIERVDNTL